MQPHAYGALNLTPNQFWNECSPGDIVDLWEGYLWRDKIAVDMHIQLLRVIRWVGWVVYAMTPKKKNARNKSPERLFRLPGDKQLSLRHRGDRGDGGMSPERLKEIEEKWGKPSEPDTKIGKDAARLQIEIVLDNIKDRKTKK